MATRHLLADLVAAARESGLPSVEVESVGGVDAAQRVAAGEAFDLVILAVDALQRLAAEGHVDPETVTPLVRSQVAVAVTGDHGEVGEDSGEPAFADADRVRDAIRRAHRIGYSTGPSGVALVRMIDGWGLGDEVGDRLVQARPGVPVARMVADGVADLGFQQLSELVGQEGVHVLGVLPDDCAIDTVFSGAVASASADPVAARTVLDFLATEPARQIASRHSFGTP